MKALTYKGFSAKVEYSDEDACYVGHINGISDIIGFHGENEEELRENFQDTIDNYLECCADMGKEPQKQCSGKILLRLPPEIHARAIALAKAQGVSLNKFLANAVCRACDS